MTANEELRRLAEAALAEEKALRADESARVESGSDDIHSGMDDWMDLDDIPPAHVAWYGAASPAVVLALLDENARLRAEVDVDAVNLVRCWQVVTREGLPGIVGQIVRITTPTTRTMIGRLLGAGSEGRPISVLVFFDGETQNDPVYASISDVWPGWKWEVLGTMRAIR